MADRRRIRTRDVLYLAVLLLTPAITDAEAPSHPLEGLKQVTVSVSVIAPDGIAPVSLTDSRLQTIVELKLRSWGFQVVSREEDEKDPAITPRVELDVTLLETRSAAAGGGTRPRTIGYAFYTTLAVTEPGVSVRNGAAATTELWSRSFLNVTNPNSVTSEVERATEELLDAFLNDWLKVKSGR